MWLLNIVIGSHSWIFPLGPKGFVLGGKLQLKRAFTNGKILCVHLLIKKIHPVGFRCSIYLLPSVNILGQSKDL